MNNNIRYLNLVGLAFGARKCVLGQDIIVKHIQQNKAKLVLIAEDTGIQTMKKITDKCKFYNVPFRIVDNREILGQAMGKSERVAVAIIDQGFAKKMMSLID